MKETELVTAIEAVEALVASCMREAGFQYVAVDVVTTREAMDALGVIAGVTDEDFAAQFGFGISIPFEETTASLVLGTNVRIFEDLAGADQVGYIRTLVGEDDEAAFYARLEEEDFSPTGGCTRTAIEQVFDAEQLNPGYYNPVDALVEQDPRVLAAQELWADCMREEGFDYANSQVMEAEFEERLDAIGEGGPGASEALTELQGEERAVAVLAFACEEEFVTEVAEAVEFEVTGLRPD